MGKSGRRAGQNIRQLAFQRRMQAILSFLGAGGLVALPFTVQQGIHHLRSTLTVNESSTATSVALPPIVYVLVLTLAIAAVANGCYWWQRANRAAQGAQGEEAIGQTLNSLTAAGWQLEYGLRLGKGVGDIDVVCRSPQGKAYVIDVKSHRGTVRFDGNQLYRQMGSKRYPFEKDFLRQVMKQALQLKQKQGLKFVTPILAFSNAQVAVPKGKLQHVYVVEKARLVALLQKLG